MKFIDRLLQNWRVTKATSNITSDSRVLDIGCFDAVLFEKLGNKLKYGIGIDPIIKATKTARYELRTGTFPQALPNPEPFDAITMLAVLEHIPEEVIPSLATSCFTYLKKGGKMIITVPDPKVDQILLVLRSLKLIHGMTLEEHHGFDVRKTPHFFGQAGFKLLKHQKFQLGLNNLFVFEKTI
jgi:2-polyprenyl-3-methyl-5-hydroxy-6-metoxy-1,4-benzoquinol methylase